MPRRRTAEQTPASVAHALNQHFGPGTIRMASNPDFEIQRIPSGILSVDDIFGGGFARGRHTEIYGPFSVGKSYICLRLIAEAQAEGLNCLWVECEGSIDPAFASHIGVDNDSLAIHKQENGHRVMDVIDTFITSGVYSVIVVDSVASLLAKAEAENEIESATMGTHQARLMSLALRKLTTHLDNSNVALVWINQVREAIGVMFGDRTVTSGGKALGHYTGQRLEIIRTETIKKKVRVVNPKSGVASVIEQPRGHRVLMKMKKDKTGGGYEGRTSTFVYDQDLKGIDPVEDLIYLGRVYGFVHKSGSNWWLDGCEDEKQASRGKFKKWLERSIALQQELAELIREESERDQEDSDEEDEQEEELDEGLDEG